MENIQFFFREIAFLAVLNFFPVKLKKKMILVKNIFREIDLFDFTSFFGLDFFKSTVKPLDLSCQMTLESFFSAQKM